MSESKKTKIDVISVTDELAASIETVALAAQQMANGRLTQRAIILLLRDATNMSMGDIKRVLDALPNLARWYLKP